MDCDSNLCTFRRGIQHVEEASSHTQVTASTAKPGIGSDFGYFCVRDESIPCRTTALGVHSFLFTPIAYRERCGSRKDVRNKHSYDSISEISETRYAATQI